MSPAPTGEDAVVVRRKAAGTPLGRRIRATVVVPEQANPDKVEGFDITLAKLLATYIIGEMRTPQHSLPRSMLAGTLIVLVLYLALNAVFLYTTLYLQQVEGYSPLDGGLIFLAASARVESGRVRVRQFLLPDYPHEPALLRALTADLRTAADEEAALVARVPCITTVSGAAAAVHAIANARARASSDVTLEG